MCSANKPGPERPSRVKVKSLGTMRGHKHSDHWYDLEEDKIRNI